MRASSSGKTWGAGVIGHEWAFRDRRLASLKPRFKTLVITKWGFGEAY